MEKFGQESYLTGIEALKKKKQLRQGYRFFECEFCGHSWKEKSRDAKSPSGPTPSGSTCPDCSEESHPVGHEIDSTISVDEYGNLV